MEAFNGFSPSRQALFHKAFCALILVLCALWAIPGRAQTYVSDDNVGHVGELTAGGTYNANFITGLFSPAVVAVSGSTLYVAEGGSGSVGTFNAVTGAAINPNFITGMSIPNGLALSGTILYVSDVGTNKVSEYNANSGALISANFITGLKIPGNLYVSGSTLFVANSIATSGSIGEYNATTGAPINTAFINGLNYPAAMVISGTTLFVDVVNSGAIAQYNPVTGALVSGTFITGLTGDPNLALSGSNLFVTNQNLGTVSEYNAVTGALITGAFISGVPNCNGIAVAVPVTTTSSPSVGGTTAGAGIYSTASTITVTATANSGYTFSNWTVNGNIVSTSSSYTFSVSGSASLVANFTSQGANGPVYVSEDTFGDIGALGVGGAPFNANFITGFSGPAQVAVSGSTLYVAQGASGSVGTYNALTGATINSNFITGMTTPNGLTISGTLLYVTDIGTGKVSVFNAATGALIHANFVTGLNTPACVYISGSALYVSSAVATSGSVGEYNAVTGAAINTGFIAGLNHPTGMLISGTTLLVTIQNSNLIAAYDPNSGALVTGTFIGGLSGPSNIALSGNNLFVTNQSAGTVGEYNSTTGALISGTFITGATNDNGIAIAVPVTTTSSPSLGGTTAGAGTYSTASNITVTATANSNYTFSNWTVNGNIVSTSTAYTFTVTGSTSLVANFSNNGAPTANLVVLANPPAGGTVSGSGTFAQNSSQQITATANPGYAFTGWNDAVTTNPRTVNVPPGGATYTANFSPTDLLTVIADPTNAGVVSGGGAYVDGSQIQISATANIGYAFTGWSDGVTTNPRTVIVVPGGASYAANFVPQTDVLYVLTDPSNGGTVMGSGTFPDNSQQQISATANPGFVFTGWDDGVTTNPRTVTVPLGGAEYVANFSPSAILSVAGSPSNGGEESIDNFQGFLGGELGAVFAVGTFHQITATAATGYTFTGWSDGVTTNPRTVALPAGGVTYTAQYVVTYLPPLTPVNLTPLNAASNVSAITTLTASPFSDPDVNVTQLASEWVVTRVSDSTIVQDVTEDTADMNYLSGVSLTGSTAYQWKVRYEDSHDLWSPFSAPTLFITGSHVYRPDGLIGFSLGALHGTDVYSSDGDGETLSTSILPLHSKTALVIAQNDGNIADTIVFRGDASNSKFVVRYFNGPNDVSRFVTAGTFKVARLRPSAIHGIRVIVAPRANSAPGDEFILHVTVSSLADPSSTDTVVYDVTTQ